MTQNADSVRYNSEQGRVEWWRGNLLLAWHASESVESVEAWRAYWGLPPIGSLETDA